MGKVRRRERERQDVRCSSKHGWLLSAVHRPYAAAGADPRLVDHGGELDGTHVDTIATTGFDTLRKLAEPSSEQES